MQLSKFSQRKKSSQRGMAEAADAEAMRKKFIQMQEEMDRLRKIIQKQKKKVR